MPTGDFPPPNGMKWTDAAGWVSASSAPTPMTGPVITETLVEALAHELARLDGWQDPNALWTDNFGIISRGGEGSPVYLDYVEDARALVAGPLARFLVAHQQVTAERDEARALVAKFTSGCPWDGPRSEYEAINPEQPCPVCGDLGTWDAEDQKPSRCVASAHSRKEWREDTATSELARRAPQGAEISQAATDVLAERRRQVSSEGWTPEHDDTHGRCEMASAAACYATAPSPVGIEREWVYPDTPKAWPWHSSWWKPGFYRRNLVKAAALLIAEIERWDRLEARTALARAATAREGA